MSFFDTILDTAGTSENTGIKRDLQPKPVVGESQENEKISENHKNGHQNDAARQPPRGENQKTPHAKPEKLSFLKPCLLCGGRNFIYATAGGFFCEVCNPEIPGKPVEATGQNRQVTDQINSQKKESFAVAWPWIRERLPILLAATWSRSALLRRGKHHHPCGAWGVAWLSVWRKPSLTVTIGAHGEIVFKYQSCGRSITQTAFPEVSFFQAQKKNQVETNIGERNPRESQTSRKDPQPCPEKHPAGCK